MNSPVPQSVRTQIALHLSTCEHEIAEVREIQHLTPAGSPGGIRLMARREQLAAQAKAWSEILAHVQRR